MFSMMRRPATLAGLFATFVLIAAMTGGAWAAKKYLITSTKQISPSVLKKLRGKQGPQGAPGQAGANGQTGAQGAAGPQGSQGDKGSSVTGTAIPSGGACGPGVTGVKYTLEGVSTNVCNGKEGKEGSPWTPESELPEGATLTGAWQAPESTGAPISFPLALPEPLEGGFGSPGGQIHKSDETGFATNCPGTTAEPSAEPGHLCIYLGPGAASPNLGIFDPSVGPVVIVEGSPVLKTKNAGRTGAVLAWAPAANSFGTFAVTAPEGP